MKRIAGYGAWTVTETGAIQREMDTVQCCHCQQHIFVKPGTSSTVYLIPDRIRIGEFNEEPGAWCRNCMAPVCLKCHEIGICDPYLRKIERSETETAMRDIRARFGHRV